MEQQKEPEQEALGIYETHQNCDILTCDIEFTHLLRVTKIFLRFYH